MLKFNKYPILAGLLFVGIPLNAQKVGLVLSGGGATGLAHIGVLKALEENGIPIDYITGTSAGAMVGGLYASGYSPEEIEALVLSDKFLNMAQGKIEDKFIYYFKQQQPNPSIVNFRLSADSLLQTALPTNLVNPTLMDYEMMAGLTGVSAATNGNFDSLFVPFRCVASDILEKKSVIFKSGNLNEAIRASMTYPFYFKPIRVNGILLFDGGMYNNFPADVMYQDFLPDVIIGSNVSGNVMPPDEDNLRSQIMNMIVIQQDFTLQCEGGIILEPGLDISTFDFNDNKKTIQTGYDVTIKNIDSIKSLIGRTVSKEDVSKKRKLFKSKIPSVKFSTVTISGLNKRQSEFVRKTIINKRDSVLTLEALKPRYFRIFNDERIAFIYPHTKYNSLTKEFELNLEIKKDKDYEAFFGGNFSSRPINSGFIGINYHLLRKSAWTFNASSSFGKLYSSGKIGAKFEPPSRLPFYIESEFVLHRWDFYKSFATFFEDVKPSYIIQEEKYIDLNIGFPVKNKTRIIGYGRYFELNDSYYQVPNFLSSDTSDLTKIYGNATGIQFERSTLNKKQYANDGTYLLVTANYFYTREYTIPGSTSYFRDTNRKDHYFPSFKVSFQHYFNGRGKFTVGFNTEVVYSLQDFYGNYISSVLSAPAYQPLPFNYTLFLPQYRVYQYASAGIQLIYTIRKNWDIRAEGYYFQPYQSLRADGFNRAQFTPKFSTRYFMGGGSIIYHSPIGPIGLMANYYHQNEQPLYLMFNFGYLIFNKNAAR